MIIDAHLDLAYNVTRGRDVLRPAAEQPIAEGEIATVGLPDLRAGGVNLVCATIFTLPADDKTPGYRTPQEAFDQGWSQMQWYLDREREGHFAFVRSREDLQRIGATSASSCATAKERQPHDLAIVAPSCPQRAILLLEGADPLRTPADVQTWFDAGMRIVGLAWRRTRYAGGTGAPGPLTAEGVSLVKELDQFGIIHDASHLAEESFWQLLHLSRGPVMASHSNCRAIVPTDRQLSDEMIQALIARGGVIGINFFDKFLVPPSQMPRRATLADVVAHVKHICDLAGNANHVAIGTDMDGGLGREQIPVEIRTSADLPKVGEALSGAGYSDQDVKNILSGNWLRFFGENLA